MSKITTSLFRAFASHYLLYYHHHFYYSPPLLSLSQTAEKRLAGSDGGESVVLVIVRRGEGGNSREDTPFFVAVYVCFSRSWAELFWYFFGRRGRSCFFDTHPPNTCVGVDVVVVHMVSMSPSFLLSLVLGGDICHGGGSFRQKAT